MNPCVSSSTRAWSTRISATVLVVAALLASTASAEPLPAIHIDNFSRVSATYFRGAQPEGSDYRDLAANGVKAIINLTSDDSEANEPTMTAAVGMKYFSIPMTTHTVPTPAQVQQFLAIVNDPANQPVYVHCVGGSHRTGVMTAMYRMVDEHWTGDRAFAEMKTFKFGLDFLHPEFKKFVLDYHVPATDAHVAEVAPK